MDNDGDGGDNDKNDDDDDDGDDLKEKMIDKNDEDVSFEAAKARTFILYLPPFLAFLINYTFVRSPFQSR